MWKALGRASSARLGPPPGALAVIIVLVDELYPCQQNCMISAELDPGRSKDDCCIRHPST